MGSESPVVRSCLCAVYSSTLSSHPVWDAVWPQLSWLLEVLGVSVLKGSASDLSSSRHSLCSRAYLCPFFSNSLWLLYASPLQSLRKRFIICLPCSSSLLVISLQTTSKQGRAGISYLLTFLSKSKSSIYSFMHLFNKYLGLS